MAVQEIRQYHDNFEIWHSAYTNMTFLAHQHTEVELVWVRDGAASVTVNNQDFFLSTGDLLLCQSGAVHYSNSPNTKNVLEFILFNPSLVQSRHTPLSLTTQHITAKQLESKNMLSCVESLFSDVAFELNARQAFYEKVVQNTLKVFLYKLERCFPVKLKQYQNSHENLPFISEALNYMKDHLADELTLNQVAASINIEAGYFSRIFKKYVGLNFVKYRNLLRLDEAITQIQETDKSISSIAFDCGFQNIRTLNRVFIQYTGKKPSDFRKDTDLVFLMNIHPHRKNPDSVVVTADSPLIKLDD